jgi:hypothetical protein
MVGTTEIVVFSIVGILLVMGIIFGVFSFLIVEKY